MKKDLLCILALYLVVILLFHKVVFEDMRLSGRGDDLNATAWGRAGKHIEETYHEDALWMPCIFCGMPAFASLGYSGHNLNYGEIVLWIPGRWLTFDAHDGWLVWHYFLAGLFLFLFARTLKIPSLPSLCGALVLALNPMMIELSQVGHGSKLMALSYIPLLFLLTHRLFHSKNLWLDFGLLAAGVGTILLTNHVQMAFYGLFSVSLYALYLTIVKSKKVKHGRTR